MSFRKFALIAAPIAVWVTVAAAPLATASDKPINIYSARKAQLIQPLLDRFSEASGYKINLVTGKADALLARLRTEGADTPADVLLTTDVGRLHQAKQAGLLQALKPGAESDVLREKIPARYRDPDGHWFGLSLRARVIMLAERARNADTDAHLRDYEDLADPRWRGKICIRSSSNIYNQSMVASLISHLGEKQTQAWAQGLVKNFARSPTGGDRDQILAAAGGLCDIAVANTYYLAMMLNGNDDAQVRAARMMHVVWPNQDGRGTHINISGAGVTAASSNRRGATALLEYLVGDEAQRWYAETNNEFPVIPGVIVKEVLPGWGSFKRDTATLSRLGELNAEAVKLTDRAGWR